MSEVVAWNDKTNFGIHKSAYLFLHEEADQPACIIGSLVQVIMKRYPNWLDGESACWYPSRYPKGIERRRSPWHAAARQPYALSCPLRSVTSWNTGNGQPPLLLGWSAEARSFSSWRLGTRIPR